jgi:alpha-glucosidase
LTFLGKSEQLTKESFAPVVGKANLVADHYRSLKLKFSAKDERQLNLNLVIRAYNEGVAIRYLLPRQSGLEQFTIQNELTRFGFADDFNCFGLNLGKYANSHEGEFDPIKASLMREHHLYDNPLV